MTPVVCDVCRIGRCHSVKETLVLPLGDRSPTDRSPTDHMLVLPDAPAYVCDICSHRFFEHEFLAFIRDLLERSAAATPRSVKRPSDFPGSRPPWAMALRSRYN